MAALLRILVVVAVFLGIALFLNITYDRNEQSNLLGNDSSTTKAEDPQADQQKVLESSKLAMPKKGLASLIGKSTKTLQEYYGKPTRIDPTEYGYKWWIYHRSDTNYFQVGVLGDKVATIYAIGSKTNITPFKIGESTGSIFGSTPIESFVSLDYKGSSYRFELTEEDMNNRPLIRIGDSYVILYIDKFTGTLSSVRFMDAPTLIKLRPYELVYRGELLQVSTSDTGVQSIDRSMEEQIFDISNIMRLRFHLKKVKWDEKTAKVALGHSVDMYKTKRFSHTSKKYGELADRLEAGEVFYQLAGENIAANYIDAPAVVEGWLNSKGHRENLLNKEFTYLGVGVYNKYYTQNFIQKW